MDHERTLDRFLKAQEHDYRTALTEIRSGHKSSHWIWYIFPQMEGLGMSHMSQYYGIQDMAEAKAYLKHPVLGPRLVEISEALLDLESNDPAEVMGWPDDMKLKSSMTLFSLAEPENTVFEKVLEKFFDGERDENTIRMLHESSDALTNYILARTTHDTLITGLYGSRKNHSGIFAGGKTMKYAIVYSSKTGNTKMLAERLQDILPKQDCLYCGTPDEAALTAERLYVGFWCDKGTCDADTATFLKNVRDKEIFLFGTAGFGGEPSYFDKILKKAQENLSSDVRVAGTFMCQGKMPMSVRERYEKMMQAPKHAPNLKMLIKNFDAALSHPDEEDLKQFEDSVKEARSLK